MLIAARLALRCLAPSFAIRGTMMRAAAWVSPPPSQSRVKKESDQENGGQVDAEISLFGIGVHSPASEFLGHLLLCPGEKWHHDEGNTGQENSGNAVLSSFSTDDIGNGLIADVNTQCQEAEATILRLSFSFRSRLRTSASTAIRQSSTMPEVTRARFKREPVRRLARP